MQGNQLAKKAAASAAADLVRPGMRLGLGTGSTAALFIEALGERCRTGLSIQALASSKASQELALSYQIPLLDVNQIIALDLTVDGADEIDPQKRMIKGGGGALLREKIVASMSQEMLIIVDSSKRVQALGAFPLPVEVLPFAFHATVGHLNMLGYKGAMRLAPNGSLYKTDNGNYICDLKLTFPCHSPEEEERKIRSVPGVLGTGFFLNLAGRVITGYPDGKVEIQG